MSNNELTHPTDPIHGGVLSNLKLVLESRLGGGEVRDLDLAMLMNVPVNRLSQLKRAKSSVHVMGKSSENSGFGTDEASEGLPSLRPSQAILVRLLLKRPDYAPIPIRPSNPDVFELISPFMHGSMEGSAGRREPQSRKMGFAPLFGRSYISSYKMLSDTDTGSGSSSSAVTRLQMLIVGKFAQYFKAILTRYLDEYPGADAASLDALNETGWALLREQDSLTGWMSDDLYNVFSAEVELAWRTWFNDCYLGILRDEAVSRDIDPEAAIQKGKWTNSAEVSERDLARYNRTTAPILGRSDSLFSIFRESFELTSAEAYWVLGIQIKAFYRFRQRANQRIDPPTSILVRYLFRYPEDIELFVAAPTPGSRILAAIKEQDPGFRRSQLAPLFGTSRVMSYGFASDEAPCPFFARRLATIFQQQAEKGRPIYHEIRECVEDELSARGLDKEQFWQDGRWHV